MPALENKDKLETCQKLIFLQYHQMEHDIVKITSQQPSLRNSRLQCRKPYAFVVQHQNHMRSSLCGSISAEWRIIKADVAWISLINSQSGAVITKKYMTVKHDLWCASFFWNYALSWTPILWLQRCSSFGEDLWGHAFCSSVRTNQILDCPSIIQNCESERPQDSNLLG